MFFKKKNTSLLPEQGSKIKVISCPRRYDGADAFAGWIGIVSYFGIDKEAMEVKMEDGASLLITSPGWQKRLKYEKV